MSLIDRADRVAVGRTRRTRRARATLIAGVVALTGMGSAYVAVADPHHSGVPMPTCPWHAVTGLSCPGCGGLRMTHDLLRADLAAAWADNAVLLVLSPLLLFLLVRAAARFVVGRPVIAPGRLEVSGPLGWSLLGVAVAWTVVRNLAAVG